MSREESTQSKIVKLIQTYGETASTTLKEVLSIYTETMLANTKKELKAYLDVYKRQEYYWGTKCWWIFLVLGIAGVVASLSIDNVILSSLLGVFAFSSFWTIKEVFEQRCV